MAAQPQLGDSVLIKLRGINANCFPNLLSFILSLSNGLNYVTSPPGAESTAKGIRVVDPKKDFFSRTCLTQPTQNCA